MKQLTSSDGQNVGDGAAPDVLDLERELLARGRRQQLDLLGEPHMLSSEEVVAQTGIRPETLNQLRSDNRILALDLPGSQQEPKFPAFQFEPGIFQVLPQILRMFGRGREWQAYDFLSLPEPLLRGKTPLDELRAGRREEVEKAAATVAALTQGAL